MSIYLCITSHVRLSDVNSHIRTVLKVLTLGFVASACTVLIHYHLFYNFFKLINSNLHNPKILSSFKFQLQKYSKKSIKGFHLLVFLITISRPLYLQVFIYFHYSNYL